MSEHSLASWTVNQHGVRVTIILDHPGQSSDFRICRFLENGYHTADTVAVAADKEIALLIVNCLNLHDELVAMVELLSGRLEDITTPEDDARIKSLLAKAKGEANVD